MADKPLDGKVALITGAGSSMGMGREMALALAEAGARVALMDVNAEQLERNVND
ncbi:MAG: SDR family NAD(P)-dependent oxidoreductase, partial [Chloroflexi bacterium]|nr:SDR family NAD(P)-dependent oxidoreductase [Chloroflexota bacterium]